MSTRMEDLRNEFLSDVAAHAATVLQDHGVDDDVAEQAGAAIADHLADHWGGQVLSVPKDYAYKLAQRDVEILARYTGDNLASLAREYDMTTRGVRKLLARATLRQRDSLQGSLFG